jgi:membrane complex biogenesis BtpA family protein
MQAVLEQALHDAFILQAAGVNALVVENFNDDPFFPETTEPETVAAITLAADAVRKATGLPIGINVLRNSWKAAMGIAAVVGAHFIRINVLTDVMITDQGMISATAAQLLRYRNMLQAKGVLIFADIFCKHAVPLVPRPLEVVAQDMVERGGADALLVSGLTSADPPRREDLQALRAAVPEVPLIIGSGMSIKTVHLLEDADAAIFGYGAKPHLKAPIDAKMAMDFMDEVRRVRTKVQSLPKEDVHETAHR